MPGAITSVSLRRANVSSRETNAAAAVIAIPSGDSRDLYDEQTA
jgi:hypothetical protein